MLPRKRSDMALTRKMLTAMGIENDQIDQIIESHTDVTDGLKKEVEELREQASRVPSLEKEIEDLKAAQPTEDWQAKYDELKTEFDGYKAKVSEEQAAAEKANLYRAMLREAGVEERRIDSIMKVTDLGNVSVVDGAIASPEEVKQAITEEWGDFITKSSSVGATVEEPPASTSAMSKSDILAIKDTSQRQQAIADNIELFQ